MREFEDDIVYKCIVERFRSEAYEALSLRLTNINETPEMIRLYRDATGATLLMAQIAVSIGSNADIKRHDVIDCILRDLQ